MYIWEFDNWPHFVWNEQKISNLLGNIRYKQGRLFGMVSVLGFDLKNPIMLNSITADIIKSSEIEGVSLNLDEVRSSVAWKLGIEDIGVPSADRYIDGIVDVMFDAVYHNAEPLTEERLFAWHQSLFPIRSKLVPITIGGWRKGDMQVVSGRYGSEKVYYEAPEPDKVPEMMLELLRWINTENNIDSVLKAAIVHLWFVTIHPFSDGNGRMARIITDMLLARADNSPYRFYSISTQIANNRKLYYNVLERSQKGTLDITEWLLWFLEQLDNAIVLSMKTIDCIIQKAAFWAANRAVVMNERQTRMVNMLWDGFEGKLTSSKWAKINKCSSDTALRDIQDLLAKNILVRTEGGGRSIGYMLKIRQL